MSDTTDAIYKALRATEIEFSALSTIGLNIFGDRKSIDYFTDAMNALGREDQLQTNLRHWREEASKLHAKIGEAKRVVTEQAEDGGIWFVAQTAAEAYLQQELRKLHAAIEGKSSAECARAAIAKATGAQ